MRTEAIDGNGLLPMRAPGKVFVRAYDFRRWLRRELPAHLGDRPSADPLRRLPDLPAAALPKAIARRWPAADDALLEGTSAALAALPIDHQVAPSEVLPGGSKVAVRRLEQFIEGALPRYEDDRNHPDTGAASGLSPYLHFGHIGTHQILAELARHEQFDPDGDGEGDAIWTATPPTLAFLDELVTWRELGLNFCHERPDDYDRLESLPNWAQKTIEEHRRDRRPEIYSLDELANARTDDEIWNAAQRELRDEGRMHNYLRMLWGKKIYQWTPSPDDALQVLIELNNRFAIDGRDPNSYSGIFWVLGRYDRAWGPERPVFGKLRYMTSDSTRRKLRLREYLARYGPDRAHRA